MYNMFEVFISNIVVTEYAAYIIKDQFLNALILDNELEYMIIPSRSK